MTTAEIIVMRAENAALKDVVSRICKVYSVLRPVLTVLKFFAFIKKGGKVAIEGAIVVLDAACEVEKK